MLNGKTILVGVTGSIAAYKSAELVSRLKKLGANVHVLMTKNAMQFITPVTFETLTGNKCLTDTFDRNFQFNVEHVSIAKTADLFVIAPATANIISKIANGLADDMLTTTFLACKCPKLICPAMNTAMLENPITRDNINKCRHYGMQIIDSAEGLLACGDTGKGKLPEPEIIVEHILNSIAFDHTLKGKKILITAGPTREALDPVRFITNHSTGKMGYALAKTAVRKGAEVILISGPVNLKEPLGAKVIHITSAIEMFNTVRQYSTDADIIIKSAAVADYRPQEICENKIKKSDEHLSLALEKTDDILKWLGENKGEKFLCGFSMETTNMVENSKAKLVKKNLDLIVANNLKTEGAGFGTDTNIVTLISKDKILELPVMSKEKVAETILDYILNATGEKTNGN